MTEPGLKDRIAVLLPIARAQARRMARRYPHVGEDNFFSAGNEEALRCAETFDPSLGVPIEAFGATRMRYAMLQAVKTDDRQSGRRMYRDIIRKQLLGAPLEFPVESIDEAFANPHRDARTNAAEWLQQEVATLVFGILTSAPAPEDEEAMAARERAAVLEAAAAQLTEEQQWFVQKHYRDGLTLHDIAKELRVSYRSAKRLHQAIKAALDRHLCPSA